MYKVTNSWSAIVDRDVAFLRERVGAGTLPDNHQHFITRLLETYDTLSQRRGEARTDHCALQLWRAAAEVRGAASGWEEWMLAFASTVRRGVFEACKDGGDLYGLDFNIESELETFGLPAASVDAVVLGASIDEQVRLAHEGWMSDLAAYLNTQQAQRAGVYEYTVRSGSRYLHRGTRQEVEVVQTDVFSNGVTAPIHRIYFDLVDMGGLIIKPVQRFVLDRPSFCASYESRHR